MRSPFHDADRASDPCDNPECADCNPEAWHEQDDYDVTDPWWLPWMITLAVAIVAVTIVVATGSPRP